MAFSLLYYIHVRSSGAKKLIENRFVVQIEVIRVSNVESNVIVADITLYPIDIYLIMRFEKIINSLSINNHRTFPTARTGF